MQLIQNALNSFKSIKNNYLPNNIIIYRQVWNEKQFDCYFKNNQFHYKIKYLNIK